jgi:hypothetical protein
VNAPTLTSQSITQKSIENCILGRIQENRSLHANFITKLTTRDIDLNRGDHLKISKKMDPEADKMRDLIIPDDFRLLMIGDSHIRRIEEPFRAMYPSANLKIISAGSKTHIIIDHYRDHIEELIEYDPTHIILHEGHNNMAHDPSRNPLPEISRDVCRRTLWFAALIHSSHPNAKLYISATLPRAIKKASTLNPTRTLAFNKGMKRHRQRIRTVASRNNHRHLINDFIWECISQAQEKTELYLEDGLHLNDEGLKLQSYTWLSILLKDRLKDIQQIEDLVVTVRL